MNWSSLSQNLNEILNLSGNVPPTEIDSSMLSVVVHSAFLHQYTHGLCSMELIYARCQHTTNLAGNKNLVLPVPVFNVINIGSHAGNKVAMQEFIIIPIGASSFKEAMKMGVEVYRNLKSVIKKKFGQDSTNVGDEGGYAPNIQVKHVFKFACVISYFYFLKSF
ncbi:enolase [Tanacetum coccineum]